MRIAIAIIATLIVAGIAYPFATASFRRSNGEGLAVEWARTMFPGSKPIPLCQGTDTDGDGYISCTAKVNGQTIPLDCYSYIFFSFSNTCREQQAKTRNMVAK